MARINVTVPDEMKEWLEENPQINASGLLQKAVQKEMKKESTSGMGVHLSDNVIHSNFVCDCGEIFSYNADQEDAVCPRCGTNHDQD